MTESVEDVKAGIEVLFVCSRSHRGEYVSAANYDDGSIAVLPTLPDGKYFRIDGKTGLLKFTGGCTGVRSLGSIVFLS
jgi:6-phosphogluconolactonase (cycloisomerase 2 family)